MSNVMRNACDSFYQTYTFTDEPLVIARLPSRPVDDIAGLFSPDSRSHVRARLAAENLTQTALFVASPALYAEAMKWVNSSSQDDRIWLRLLAYLVRMSYRPTPFGLFSTVSMVQVSGRTSLGIGGEVTPSVLPDMAWVARIAEVLAEDHARETVRVALARTHIRRGNRIVVFNPTRTAASKSHGSEAALEHVPISLRSTDGVEFVERLLSEGAKPKGEVIDQLAKRFNVDTARAAKLVSSLLESGFLVDERQLHPLDDPWRSVMATAARTGSTLFSPLCKIQEYISGAQLSPERLREILAQIGEEQTKALPEAKPEIFVNARRDLSGTLNRRVFDDVATLAWLMLSERPVSLSNYRERFMAKYEGDQREVPLLDLIDGVHGIGMPDPRDSSATVPALRVHRLNEIAMSALKAGSCEVSLTERDVAQLFPAKQGAESTAESFELGFEILAASREAVEAGEYRICPGNFTASVGAGRTAARFAHMLSPKVAERLRSFEALLAEQDENIRAELVIAPAAPKALNVLLRPRVYGHEVAIGVVPSEHANHIAADDLMVGLDGGRFYVRSKKLGRRLTLQETHVVNYIDGAAPIGRALALLARDGNAYPKVFDWGPAYALPFLPRLSYGRVILCRARWRFPKEQLPEFVTEEARRHWCMPDLVSLCHGDNTLPIDVSTPAGRELLMDQAGRSGEDFIVLEETLPQPADCWMTDGNGKKYRAEFIVSALRKHPPVSPQPRVEARTCAASSPPAYGPSSEWLYYRLYCAQEDGDHIIRDIVLPILERSETTAIPRWFFVRYSDGDFHLRLRLKFGSSASAAKAQLQDELGRAFEAALASRLLGRYEIATYTPEVERYGGVEALDLCEAIFALQSAAFCSILRAQALVTDEARVQACLRSCAALLAACESVLGESAPFTSAPSKLTALQRTLVKAATNAPDMECEQYGELCRALVGLQRSGSLSQPLSSVLDSLIHMQCNRFGIFAQAEGAVRAMLYHVMKARKQRCFH